LKELNKEEESLFRELSIKNIIDLRTEKEIELIGVGKYPEFINYYNIELNSGNITQLLIPIFEKGEFHLLDADLLSKIYLDLVTNFQTELSEVFRKMLTSTGGVVYHCSHGKDRTGIVSALFYELLGVKRDFIYEDYVLSNEFRKKENEEQLEMIKQGYKYKFQKDISEAEFAPIRSLFYCKKEILENMFLLLDEKYGSIENYFTEALTFSEKEIIKLKDKYLEENV